MLAQTPRAEVLGLYQRVVRFLNQRCLPTGSAPQAVIQPIHLLMTRLDNHQDQRAKRCPWENRIDRSELDNE